MTVIPLPNAMYYGVSGDTKPTNAITGSVFFETNTRKIWFYTGTVWSEIDAITPASGEANTASNTGVAGVGIFARKTSVDLEFKNLKAGATNTITLTDDTAEDEIEFDVDAINLLLSNLGGQLTVGQLPDTTIDSTRDNTIGDHYLDLGNISVPADPAAGTRRLFMNSATGELSVRTSAGNTVSLEPAATILHNNLDNNLGDHYLDFGDIAVPASPSSGTRRLFMNSATGELSIKTSAGITKSLEISGISEVKYVIRVNGANYEAVNVSTGTIDFTNTTDATLTINSAIGAINDTGEGGTIFIERGTYECKTTINIAPASGNVVRGVALIGDRFETLLNFTPAGAVTNGIVCTMSNAKIADLRIMINTNITNAFKFTGNASGGGDRGIMQFVELDGPNAHTTGAPVTNQVGILQDGATASPYWWVFDDVAIRAFDIGFKTTGANATSTHWTNSNFWNCTVGMYMDSIEHVGSNLWFQGSTAYGRYGIEFTTNGDSNLFTNLYSELNVTGQTCATVLFDSGAAYNTILGTQNMFNDGVNFFNVKDNSAQVTNTFFTSDGLVTRGGNIKIGTATGDKVGFYGVTPVVQPTGISAVDTSTVDNTYGAQESAVITSLRTKLDSLINKLEALGLLAVA